MIDGDMGLICPLAKEPAILRISFIGTAPPESRTYFMAAPEFF